MHDVSWFLEGTPCTVYQYVWQNVKANQYWLASDTLAFPLLIHVFSSPCQQTGFCCRRGSSIVKLRLGCKSFNLPRNSVAAVVLGHFRQSVINISFIEFRDHTRCNLSSRWHMKTFAISGPSGDPIATPSTCSYNSPSN